MKASKNKTRSNTIRGDEKENDNDPAAAASDQRSNVLRNVRETKTKMVETEQKCRQVMRRRQRHKMQ
jgi:hypothetical protein